MQSSGKSIRRLSAEYKIPKSSVHRIVRSCKFYLYTHLCLVHGLTEDDFDRHVQMCEMMLNQFTENPNFILKYCGLMKPHSYFLDMLVGTTVYIGIPQILS